MVFGIDCFGLQGVNFVSIDEIWIFNLQEVICDVGPLE